MKEEDSITDSSGEDRPNSANTERKLNLKGLINKMNDVKLTEENENLGLSIATEKNNVLSKHEVNALNALNEIKDDKGEGAALNLNVSKAVKILLKEDKAP